MNWRGDKEIELGSEKLLLRPDFKALDDIETRLNVSIYQVVDKLVASKLPFGWTAQIVSSCAVSAGRSDMTKAKVGQLIIDNGLGNLNRVISDFLVRAIKGHLNFEEQVEKKKDNEAETKN